MDTLVVLLLVRGHYRLRLHDVHRGHLASYTKVLEQADVGFLGHAEHKVLVVIAMHGRS